MEENLFKRNTEWRPYSANGGRTARFYKAGGKNCMMAKNARRALFIGRFQPFHNGHLASVKHILDECGELVIAVGSPDKSHQPDNLFTLGERIEMIHESLKDEGLSARAIAIGVPDISYNALWARHVTALSPIFDVVYTNNPLVSRLFREQGLALRGIPLFRREEYDGAHIRSLMLKRGAWRRLLPRAAVRVADAADAEQRLADVAKGDKV